MIESEYSGWKDEDVLNLPYFRFCQIIEAIRERQKENIKFKTSIEEIKTRFIASMLVNTSLIGRNGREELFEIIKNFKIIKDKEDIEEDKYPHIKPGTFERIMGLLGGSK